MSAPSVRKHGVAAALLIITALLQMGCGTQSTTAPQNLFPSDQPGEVILPPDPIPPIKLPTPVDFKAEYFGGCAVFLTWATPVEGVDAMLFLDGTEMVCADAACGGYFDLCAKSDGVHTYSLRYTNGLAYGPAAKVVVTINPPVVDGSGGGHFPKPELP